MGVAPAALGTPVFAVSNAIFYDDTCGVCWIPPLSRSDRALAGSPCRRWTYDNFWLDPKTPRRRTGGLRLESIYRTQALWCSVCRAENAPRTMAFGIPNLDSPIDAGLRPLSAVRRRSL